MDAPIGTVINSMIEPVSFITENPEWMLMDGCDSALSLLVYGTRTGAIDKFNSSVLHTRPDGAINTMPDARGVFIRSMNLGRPVATGDADGNREVGLPQRDAFKLHHHTFSAHAAFGASGRDGNAQLQETTGNTSDVGENETRPRNIALYTYIKVN